MRWIYCPSHSRLHRRIEQFVPCYLLEKKIMKSILFGLLISVGGISSAFADRLVGEPEAMGPGLGSAILSSAPSNEVSDWFVGNTHLWRRELDRLGIQYDRGGRAAGAHNAADHVEH